MPYDESTADVPTQPVTITPKRFNWRRLIWDGKIGPAFWTITGIVSLTVNVILVVLLISMGQQIFTLRSIVQDHVLGGLYANFKLMDEAHIRTVIPVSTEVPAKFDLPLSTTTIVVLTEDTKIQGMTIANLNAGALYISHAKADITFPAGSELPVRLDLIVPVDQKIPVELEVMVDIPLNQTDLHEPFVGLQEVVKPYYTLLSDLPDSWQAVVCSMPLFGDCAPAMP
jgi:hypothetical protein